MVLISIDPFASRRILLVIAALLCFSALCFADPVLMAQRYSAPGVHDRSGRDVFTDFQRVDWPAREQELLPSKIRLDQSLSQPGSAFLNGEDFVRVGEFA